MSSTTRRLYYIDGNPFWLTDEEADAHPGLRMPAETGSLGGYSEKRPGKSLAMGCHPSQAGLMNAAARAAGVRGVEWDRRGRCHITSRAGRAKAMPVVGRLLGVGALHDRDGGYGDG
ncbi:MAG: hypothetical protein LLG00_16665 [Planctomycetaceae bacterium]|nr:hypothetical protein [Planctomycetaceae bacterium]